MATALACQPGWLQDDLVADGHAYRQGDSIFLHDDKEARQALRTLEEHKAILDQQTMRAVRSASTRYWSHERFVAYCVKEEGRLLGHKRPAKPKPLPEWQRYWPKPGGMTRMSANSFRGWCLAEFGIKSGSPSERIQQALDKGLIQAIQSQEEA